MIVSFQLAKRFSIIGFFLALTLGMVMHPGESKSSRSEIEIHTPVVPETLDGTTLAPAAGEDRIKRVTLIASVVDQELLNAEGETVVAKAYGFNGSSPGPTLVFTEGDQVEIKVICFRNTPRISDFIYPLLFPVL